MLNTQRLLFFILMSAVMLACKSRTTQEPSNSSLETPKNEDDTNASKIDSLKTLHKSPFPKEMLIDSNIKMVELPIGLDISTFHDFPTQWERLSPYTSIEEQKPKNEHEIAFDSIGSYFSIYGNKTNYYKTPCDEQISLDSIESPSFFFNKNPNNILFRLPDYYDSKVFYLYHRCDRTIVGNLLFVNRKNQVATIINIYLYIHSDSVPYSVKYFYVSKGYSMIRTDKFYIDDVGAERGKTVIIYR